jgi:hypothetical protein
VNQVVAAPTREWAELTDPALAYTLADAAGHMLLELRAENSWSEPAALRDAGDRASHDLLVTALSGPAGRCGTLRGGPKNNTSSGVISAPPPIPVSPTTKPTSSPTAGNHQSMRPPCARGRPAREIPDPRTQDSSSVPDAAALYPRFPPKLPRSHLARHRTIRAAAIPVTPLTPMYAVYPVAVTVRAVSWLRSSSGRGRPGAKLKSA